MNVCLAPYPIVFDLDGTKWVGGISGGLDDMIISLYAGGMTIRGLVGLLDLSHREAGGDVVHVPDRVLHG